MLSEEILWRVKKRKGIAIWLVDFDISKESVYMTQQNHFRFGLCCFYLIGFNALLEVSLISCFKFNVIKKRPTGSIGGITNGNTRITTNNFISDERKKIFILNGKKNDASRSETKQRDLEFARRLSSTNRRKAIEIASITAGMNLFQPNAFADADVSSTKTMTADSNWPLWPALPVAPYSKRRTIRYEVGDGVWAFDQLIGIYYVHVPIRMTVVKKKDGLLVFAPIAPTHECRSLLQELIDQYGPIKDIILPSVAVEHKVNAGPFARAYPNANFYVVEKQYSFPINLPNSFLGLPKWTKTLPSSSALNNMWNGELEHETLTVKPGIGSMYQDVALFHKSSKTLLLCDAIFAVNGEPPPILTKEKEYTRALLFHARDFKNEVVEDTIENRQKGWRRIVLLFNFFFPGSGRGDLGLGPISDALKTPTYKDGWGGWKPFSWGMDETKDFEIFSDSGKPTILPIIQIILVRGPDEVKRWLDVVTKWDFTQVVPAHLDAPLAIGPNEFKEPFRWVESGKNEVRFCDEDVQFLRKAEEGPLKFSVYESSLGTLRGKKSCNLVKPSS